MTRLKRNLLLRELKAAAQKDPETTDDLEDFELQKLKKQAKNELQNSLPRLIYRAKYNLPPNDPRFLDITDEEIVYELILQSEYKKWAEDRVEEEEDDNKIIYKNTDEFEDINKRLERGEDIDLESLMTSNEDWEKVNADSR